MDGFHDHLYRRWIGELAVVLAERDCDHPRYRNPRRLRACFRAVSRVVGSSCADARRDDHAGGCTCPADLPRAERVQLDRQRLLGHPAVRVFPVRGLSRLHLLRDCGSAGLLDAARVDGCGECRRSCGLRCRWRSRSSRSSSSSASSPTGTTSSCPTSCCRTRGSFRSRSGSRTSSGRLDPRWRSRRGRGGPRRDRVHRLATGARARALRRRNQG